MSEKSTSKIVTFEFDLDNPPPMTEEQWQQMERLRAMKDEDIDFSDIPLQTGLAHWSSPGLFGGPVGQLRRAALREGLLLVEPEVVSFFKEGGADSADRMNAVLREYVEAHRKSA